MIVISWFEIYQSIGILEMLLPGIFFNFFFFIMVHIQKHSITMVPCKKKKKIVQLHFLEYVYSKDIQMPAQHYTTGDTAYLPNNFHLSLTQICEWERQKDQEREKECWW